MPKKAATINCSAEQQAELRKLAASRTQDVRLVEHATIILLSIEGMQNKDIAERFGIRQNTVSDIRKRFINDGIPGLYDQPRSGKPRKYDKDFRDRVLKLLETDPPGGHASWNGALIADQLKTSLHAVWRLLREEGIHLSRKRNWYISTDPQFVVKSVDIIGLYLNPPLNAMVISVSEKPRIQALEKQTGYVKVKNGKIVRAYQRTCKRHGALNLFDTLDIATGKGFGKVTLEKNRPDFLLLMDEFVKELPRENEIHIILDNDYPHKNIDAWLKQHPNVFFHDTQTFASWLNQIEIWFGIFSRKSLRGVGFENTTRLRSAIEAYIDFYNQSPRPFIWKKSDVNGSHRRDTIDNFRH
ncbi:IS630 family transposase [bacterium]|nr:IS630 family transposase [bacterium]